MKIVFLDVDGVLNTPKTWGLWAKGDHALSIDPERVALLWEIVEATNARIVWCSSWRKHHTLDQLTLMMVRRGWPQDEVHRFIDITPGDDKGRRGDEVQMWLDATTLDVTSYVILDDMGLDEFPFPWSVRHIRTKWQQGLTPADVQNATAILQRPL